MQPPEFVFYCGYDRRSHQGTKGREPPDPFRASRPSGRSLQRFPDGSFIGDSGLCFRERYESPKLLLEEVGFTEDTAPRWSEACKPPILKPSLVIPEALFRSLRMSFLPFGKSKEIFLLEVDNLHVGKVIGAEVARGDMATISECSSSARNRRCDPALMRVPLLERGELTF